MKTILNHILTESLSEIKNLFTNEELLYLNFNVGSMFIPEIDNLEYNSMPTINVKHQIYSNISDLESEKTVPQGLTEKVAKLTEAQAIALYIACKKYTNEEEFINFLNKLSNPELPQKIDEFLWITKETNKNTNLV